jgi:hypothetical protein
MRARVVATPIRLAPQGLGGGVWGPRVRVQEPVPRHG